MHPVAPQIVPRTMSFENITLKLKGLGSPNYKKHIFLLTSSDLICLGFEPSVLDISSGTPNPNVLIVI